MKCAKMMIVRMLMLASLAFIAISSVDADALSLGGLKKDLKVDTIIDLQKIVAEEVKDVAKNIKGTRVAETVKKDLLNFGKAYGEYVEKSDKDEVPKVRDYVSVWRKEHKEEWERLLKADAKGLVYRVGRRFNNRLGEPMQNLLKKSIPFVKEYWQKYRAAKQENPRLNLIQFIIDEVKAHRNEIIESAKNNAIKWTIKGVKILYNKSNNKVLKKSLNVAAGRSLEFVKEFVNAAENAGVSIKDIDWNAPTNAQLKSVFGFAKEHFGNAENIAMWKSAVINGLIDRIRRAVEKVPLGKVVTNVAGGVIQKIRNRGRKHKNDAEAAEAAEEAIEDIETGLVEAEDVEANVEESEESEDDAN